MKKRGSRPIRATRDKLQSFELQFKSLPKNVSLVERFLQDVNETLRLDDGTMYRLQVAVTEAVNNAILHGNASDPQKLVTVRGRVTDHCFSIVIRDEGTGFDAQALPNPLEDRNLMKEHGRGVFLMRNLMDKVTFRKLKKGSEVKMKICIDR